MAQCSCADPAGFLPCLRDEERRTLVAPPGLEILVHEVTGLCVKKSLSVFTVLLRVHYVEIGSPVVLDIKPCYLADPEDRPCVESDEQLVSQLQELPVAPLSLHCLFCGLHEGLHLTQVVEGLVGLIPRWSSFGGEGPLPSHYFPDHLEVVVVVVQGCFLSPLSSLLSEEAGHIIAVVDLLLASELNQLLHRIQVDGLGCGLQSIHPVLEAFKHRHLASPVGYGRL